MKKSLLFAFMTACSLTSYSTDLSAHSTGSTDAAKSTPADLMRDQIDPTDAYAIPADSSEVEDEMEIEHLYEMEKEIQAEKRVKK